MKGVTIKNCTFGNGEWVELARVSVGKFDGKNVNVIVEQRAINEYRTYSTDDPKNYNYNPIFATFWMAQSIRYES